MGHIASALSTKVVFTSDNPRTEDPDKIIEEVEAGVEPQNFKKIMSITNRQTGYKDRLPTGQEERYHSDRRERP